MSKDFQLLPEDVQVNMLHSIAGLEKVEMMRTGYAVEYDVVVPHQLRPTLETKVIANLLQQDKQMERADMKKQRVKD